MPAFIIMAATAVATATGSPIPSAPMLSDARTVIEAQLNSAPRNGRDGGLTDDEAATVEQHYLQSIGKRIEQDKGSVGQGGQTR
ncbi:MAG: hypothetical protein JWO15_3076 [Sphingomonadales bacterium]|nr:hypothetical protein [Sphingomonadales bacterium]